MTTEYVSLRPGMTVRDAIGRIRSTGVDKETIYTCYVTTPKRVLKGAVSLRQILLSPNSRPVSELMSPTVISANTHESQEEVSRKFQEYDLIALPVVDNENRIVGIITIDDVVDVIVAMNTENIEKMAALRPAEDEYMKTGVLKLASNRIVWLLFMMLSATFTGMIISNFQGLLSQMVILASFIPMLMDTGGNCGSQSATLIIRGMAVGEIDPSCWYKVVWKEFRIGIIVGVALGVVNLLRIFLFMKDVNFAVDLTVTATLFCTIITAKILGCLLPMLAKVMKLDPALMASPMITTCVDAITLMLYFTIARSVLL
jgi:magnesium transporter